MKRAALALALIGTVVTLAGAPAQAGIVLTLDGAASCDSATGDHVVTWTLSNPTVAENIGAVVVDSTPVDASLATTSFAPNPVQMNGTSTAVSTLDGSFVGSVQIDLTLAGPTYEGAVLQAGVELPSPCPQPTTTSTTSTTVAPTTTAPPALAVAAAPTFTG